jgi:hypothetical protein
MIKQNNVILSFTQRSTSPDLNHKKLKVFETKHSRKHKSNSKSK